MDQVRTFPILTGSRARADRRAVLDLHGRLDVVVCLGCGERTGRADLQTTIRGHARCVDVMVNGEARVEETEATGSTGGTKKR